MSTIFAQPPDTPQDAPASFSGLADAAERFTKLLGLAALIFLVGMGLAYKWGATWGRGAGQHMREREHKPVFKGLPDDDKPVLFWNDDKLNSGRTRRDRHHRGPVLVRRHYAVRRSAHAGAVA